VFAAAGLDRAHWSNATPIRQIFRQAFAAAGLPYFNPHSFRSTLVTLGQKLCQSPESFKSWSQNLGHEGVLTTFYSYGTVATSRQGEIIRAMTHFDAPQADIHKLLRRLQDPAVQRAFSDAKDC
jgi:integrase/recombinase XerD